MLDSLDHVRAHLEQTGRKVADASRRGRPVLRFGEAGTVVDLDLLRVPEGLPWLGITAIVGSPRGVSVRAALVANAELAPGALGLSDGDLVLRQTLPLDGLDGAGFERALRALLDALGRVRAPTASPFAYLYRARAAPR